MRLRLPALPNDWCWELSGNVIDIRDGTHDTPKYLSDGVPLVTSKNLKPGGIDFENVAFISQEDHLAISKRSQVDQGDILFAMIGTIGNPTLVSESRDFSIKNVALFKTSLGDVCAGYLLRLLDSPLIRMQLDEATRGGTQKFVSLKVLRNLKLPFPPLQEQKRIAKILDAADALRTKRRESLSQLDALLQSTFLDLFGDPAVNPKSWEESALGEVVQVEHGYAFKSEFFSESGKYIVLTPGSFFESGGYRDQGSKTKFYTSEPPSKFILPEGVILVAMTEQAPGLLGSPLVVPKGDRYLHNQRLGRLKLSDRVLADFVFHLFNTPWVRGELQQSSTGTKVKHTSPSKIGDVVVPIPPLNHQRKFGSIVESIEKQKRRLQSSLRELEELFCSLQQRAFSGEL